MEKYRKAFVYTSRPKKYIDNEQIIVMGPKIFKTLAENGRGKFEGLINRINPQTLVRLVRRKIRRI